ncbi:GGDEF domain-containing protein [Vibrio viridaestus]|uniref:diguanylate cyclase n=1 Tax=Vibrio viridaestus TaxID=2487322 RepID=A0A3N9TBI7_9VIBR|nr:diguanylate cyclase [Vibrio viridaestus]RQW61340.1 GGDEF domain-containing protein [Vibrio viridaestus]
MKASISIIQKMVIVWLVLSIIPLLYYRHTTSEAHRFLISRFEEQGNQFLSFVDDRASQLHQRIRGIYKELSQSPLLRDYAENNDPRLKQYLEHQWYITAKNLRFFYQLRYLDNSGQEMIRVDYTQLMPTPYIVPDKELQNKGQRDYFLYAEHLSPGEQGSFGIDLEYEHGKPVIPYKPGFRLIYPIDSEGTRLGFFIANLEVLGGIDYVTSNTQHYSVDFIDSDGYYVMSSDKTKLFGDLIKERNNINLPKQNPDLWKEVSSTKTRGGALLTPAGLYIYKPFSARLFDSTKPLTLITLIPMKQISDVFANRDDEVKNDSLSLLLLLGIISGLTAVFWDSYQRIRLEKTFNKSVLDNGLAVALTNDKHRVLMANTHLCHLLGLELAEIKKINMLTFKQVEFIRKELLQGLTMNNHWHCEVDIGDKHYQMDVKELPSSFHHSKQYIYSFVDITEQSHVIDELKDQSQKDPATGLWNKKKFNDSLLHYSRLRLRYPDQPSSCLAIIDIDDFKSINDTYGHHTGDKVINTLASQLKNRLRDTDIIARIGGDEFAVILQHIDVKAAYELMHRICNVIDSFTDVQVTVSIGISEISEDNQLTFMHADKALYRSKRKGKNCVSAHGFENLTVVKTSPSP